MLSYLPVSLALCSLPSSRQSGDSPVNLLSLSLFSLFLRRQGDLRGWFGTGGITRKITSFWNIYDATSVLYFVYSHKSTVHRLDTTTPVTPIITIKCLAGPLTATFMIKCPWARHRGPSCSLSNALSDRYKANIGNKEINKQSPEAKKDSTVMHGNQDNEVKQMCTLKGNDTCCNIPVVLTFLYMLSE